MNSKKNILIFSNINLIKGEASNTGNWILTLVEELLKYDKEYNIFIAFHDNTIKTIEYAIKDKLGLIRIPLFLMSYNTGKFLSNWSLIDKYKNATSDYLQIVNRINPDLIHIFGLESPFIRIINKVKQPAIVHIQGLISSIITKYYPRFSSLEILKSNGLKDYLKGQIPWNEKRRWLRHIRVENKIYNDIKYCLGRTDWDRRCINAIAPQAEYFYCQEIMRKPFYNAIWSPPKNEKWILYTTIREMFSKNIDIIYESCDILERYHKKLNFEWRVAGITDEDITPKIMKNRKLNPRNLKLLGSLNAEEIVNQMLEANLFIYPSAIENSSNAVQEAMLLGIPIIATCAGGLTSIIEDKKTGILVNEGDPLVLAGAVIEMLENQNEAIKMAQKGREIALERLNPQKIVKELLNIYKIILNNNTQ